MLAIAVSVVLRWKTDTTQLRHVTHDMSRR
jgi:hypothetical protein